MPDPTFCQGFLTVQRRAVVKKRERVSVAPTFGARGLIPGQLGCADALGNGTALQPSLHTTSICYYLPLMDALTLEPTLVKTISKHRRTAI